MKLAPGPVFVNIGGLSIVIDLEIVIYLRSLHKFCDIRIHEWCLGNTFVIKVDCIFTSHFCDEYFVDFNNIGTV